MRLSLRKLSCDPHMGQSMSVRCCYCHHFAEFIWWSSPGGYHNPCCNTCYPKAVKACGGDDGSFALDGSKIFKGVIGAKHG